MKKSINFDLDTNKLKEIYPNKSYTQAYDDIKKFLTKNKIPSLFIVKKNKPLSV